MTMQNISQLICLTVFLVLMVATSMGRSEVNRGKINEDASLIHKKIRDNYCFTLTMKDEACHQKHCSNSTTYVHTCDYYNGSNCDYYSGHIDICNGSNCQNTSRHIDACYHDISEDCGDADVTCHSCTNDVCRNRTTHFHLCLKDSNSLKDGASAFCNGCYIGIYAFDCIENVMKSFGRRLSGGSHK